MPWKFRELGTGLDWGAIFGPFEIVILVGAFAGGLVNGLTGFGQALIAMPVYLIAVPPLVATPLAAAGALLGQLQTLPTIWRSIKWHMAMPLILMGIAGVPVGVWLLPKIALWAFKLGIGIFLILYCVYTLYMQDWARLKRERLAGALFVGFSGGVLSGLTAFPGPLPIIWASLRDWTKDEKRGVIQIFNLIMQVMVLTLLAATNRLTYNFFYALLFSLPANVIGVQIGKMIYDRLDAPKFDKLVLVLLLASGCALVLSAALG